MHLDNWLADQIKESAQPLTGEDPLQQPLTRSAHIFRKLEAQIDPNHRVLFRSCIPVTVFGTDDREPGKILGRHGLR